MFSGFQDPSPCTISLPIIRPAPEQPFPAAVKPLRSSSNHPSGASDRPPSAPLATHHLFSPQGVAYRDMKMVNVLLDGGDPPVVKLIDFGVSRCAPGCSAGGPLAPGRSGSWAAARRRSSPHCAPPALLTPVLASLRFRRRGARRRTTDGRPFLEAMKTFTGTPGYLSPQVRSAPS